MITVYIKKGAFVIIALFIQTSTILSQSEFRTIDGSANNLENIDMGKAFEPLSPLTGSYYFADNIGEPNGMDRPSPRVISNAVFAQNGANIPGKLNHSDAIWAFGQFLDHDITFVAENPEEPIFIPVPECDSVMDPRCQGRTVILQARSVFSEGSGESSPRTFPNIITQWIDGSSVYGSNEEHASWLRTYSEGKLHVSEHNLLPVNTIDKNLEGDIDPAAPHMDNPTRTTDKLFVAGDSRANENFFLIAMHTIFHREHNTICDEILAIEPNLSDEEVYLRARKILAAKLQAIVYYEWLPALGLRMAPYRGYDPSIDATISNEFSAAAFRFGHTMLNSQLLRLSPTCNAVPEGHIGLKETFFTAEGVINTTTIDPLLKGMCTQTAQEFDTKVVDDVRNFLFVPDPEAPFGLDLVALNIMRGRERGISDYNTTRASLGLAPIQSFDEITRDIERVAILDTLYGDVNDIDLWVGLLSEDPLENSVFGETLTLIIADQFRRLRDGDRFYFENDPFFSNEEIEELRQTKLADIIRRNSDTHVQDDVFFNRNTPCFAEFVEEDEYLDIFVSPNPISDFMELTIFMEEDGKGTLTIRNNQGQVVQVIDNMPIQEGYNPYPMFLDQRFPAGVYMMTIESQNHSKTCRVVKTR